MTPVKVEFVQISAYVRDSFTFIDYLRDRRRYASRRCDHRALSDRCNYSGRCVASSELDRRTKNREKLTKRLKVKVMEPLTPSALWGRESVVADGVLVSKLTADGFVPAEIQITAIHFET